MLQKKLWFRMSWVLAVLAVVLMLPTAAVAASKYKVLHRFNGLDGALPYARMVFDTAGNLYGTTADGGAFGYGVAFMLTSNRGGSWTESVLHNFTDSGGDGAGPYAGLIFDPAGNLYGTTFRGGSQDFGTVFKLTRNSDGSWTESVLHSFTLADGSRSFAGLTFDAEGNLYGTTPEGGLHSGGVVFKLKPNSDGSWTESVLHSFCSHRLQKKCSGSVPQAGLLFDTAGNLYGTTSVKGTRKCINAPGGCGTVFELMPQADGSWTESVLHSFAGADGAVPYAGLIFDTAGNLFGTTISGGKLGDCNNVGCGVVFELNPDANGGWTESVLHKFANNPAAIPYFGNLISDEAGNFYGTTVLGGPVDGGTVFKLSPQSGGKWTYSVLHVFQGRPAEVPAGGLVLDKAGNLYGTAADCGSGYNCQGVVFEITP